MTTTSKPNSSDTYETWMSWEKNHLARRAQMIETMGEGFFTAPPADLSSDTKPMPKGLTEEEMRAWFTAHPEQLELVPMRLPPKRDADSFFNPDERVQILQDARALLQKPLNPNQMRAIANFKQQDLLPQIQTMHCLMRDEFADIYPADLRHYWEPRPLYYFVAGLSQCTQGKEKMPFITAHIIFALAQQWYPEPSDFAKAEAPYFFQAMQETFTRGGAERQEFLSWLLLRFARTESPDAAASPDSIIEKLAPCLKIYCQAVGDKYLDGSFLREFTAAVQAQRMLPKDFPFHTMAATIRDARGPR